MLKLPYEFQWRICGAQQARARSNFDWLCFCLFFFSVLYQNASIKQRRALDPDRLRA